MSDGEKVVFLAFSNPKTEVGGVEYLACRTCRNKTFLAVYDPSSGYPTLKCACCSQNCGRAGWAPEDAA